MGEILVPSPQSQTSLDDEDSLHYDKRTSNHQFNVYAAVSIS